MPLAINDIYHSIQGEGSYAGTPMVFIRLAGCNLRCPWCDQPDTVMEGYKDRQSKEWELSYKHMEVEEIINVIRKFTTFRVCLTGGEPLVHKLGELTARLQSLDLLIHIETNGTLFNNWVARAFHVTCSPKRETHYFVHPQLRPFVREYKIIVDDLFDDSELQQVMGLSSDANLYLQPAGHHHRVETSTTEKAIALVQKYPTRLKLSVQLHKLIGVK